MLALPSSARRRHGVTVVMPCYRYGHYLRQAVRSALNQRQTDTRVIIVDDHSPDDSLMLAEELAAEDSRVSVIAHRQNAGHIQTYNDGLDAVETEFVTLVSADDLVAPGALDRAVAVFERFPRVGLVYGKVVTFSGSLPPRGRSLRNGIWRISSGRNWIDRIASSGFNPIMSPEATLRTDVVRAIGGYNPELPHSGDLEYWLRVAARWDVAQTRGAVQAAYRVHGSNMHLTAYNTTLANAEQKLAAFEFLRSESVRETSPWGPGLFDRAPRTIAEEAIFSARAHRLQGDDVAGSELAAFALKISPDPEQRDEAESILSSEALRERT